MMRVCLYNKLIYILFPFFPQGENIVNPSFPLEGFSLAFTDNSEGVICRLQAAGCKSEFGKRVKCPEWFTDLSEHLKQNITIMFW